MLREEVGNSEASGGDLKYSEHGPDANAKSAAIREGRPDFSNGWGTPGPSALYGRL